MTAGQAERFDAVRARRRSLRRAMGRLEATLAAPAQGRLAPWTEAVGSAVADLDQCMRRHVEQTEGPHGFHSDIVTAAPRLAHQVSLSVREHRRITAAVAALGAACEQPAGTAGALGSADGPDFDAVRRDGTALLGILARHRQRGADMIFEAYEADVGDGD